MKSKMFIPTYAKHDLDMDYEKKVLSEGPSSWFPKIRFLIQRMEPSYILLTLVSPQRNDKKLGLS